jgi:hypothetical protein
MEFVWHYHQVKSINYQQSHLNWEKYLEHICLCGLFFISLKIHCLFLFFQEKSKQITVEYLPKYYVQPSYACKKGLVSFVRKKMCFSNVDFF